MTTQDTVSVFGSHGALTVDRTTGTILSYEREPIMGEDAGYETIERFDPATLTQSHMDILLCGYWEGGRYEAPEEEYAAWQAENERAMGQGRTLA